MKHGFLTLAHAFAGGVDACEGRAPRRSAVPPSFGFPERGEKRSGKNKWEAETKERTPDLPEWCGFFKDPAGGIAFGKDVTCQHTRGQPKSPSPKVPIVVGQSEMRIAQGDTNC